MNNGETKWRFQKKKQIRYPMEMDQYVLRVFSLRLNSFEKAFVDR